jgi:hypothetical protein
MHHFHCSATSEKNHADLPQDSGPRMIPDLDQAIPVIAGPAPTNEVLYKHVLLGCALTFASEAKFEIEAKI